ncbi:LuxQ periplasmic sensor domain-containing protein [Vibrio genomosp. F10 str. 9ZC157]|uniref:Autoinducer 2 sensor kinase/phosphatase LuxQ n=1 Tax=Vibrio genomosp. F10 str. ZF-129 TaxID=1187848 RepID=A0A1E5BB06_9VIBR|nr:LuxQ periplasmic sensor domain-containing protein [Vibrio genomosp. F10]OEE31300.1 ATPase [Vibrio genomosp. F10 str. ZF-129]OEE96533.1 ATPase [Vibrio genomosp. F10 str. 9ZC157]
MIFRLSLSNKSTNLATLITRTVFSVMAAVTLFVLFQNSQATSRAVDSEVERTRRQTNSLVQTLFNLELTSLRTQQDSYSRNETLIKALHRENTDLLEQFFTDIDELNPQLPPDFRYLTIQDKIFWGDESYTFFGIEDDSLTEMSQSMNRSGNWYLVRASSLLGSKILLLRRIPIVDLSTGEVLAMYHIGIVLNSNYSLMDAIKQGSNSDNALMVMDKEVIASTIGNVNTDYEDHDVLSNFAGLATSGRYIVVATPLSISGTSTSITIYTVQSRISPVEFNYHYNWWGGVLMVFMLLLGIVTWYWLNKRVSAELDSLMDYAESSVDKREITHFVGSKVKEFDLIGNALEHSFKRLTEQEKQFEDLFNFSLSPILFWNTQGEIVKINPAGEKYFNAHKAGDGTHQILVDQLWPKIKMAAQGATLTGVNIPIAEKTFRWNLSPIKVNEHVRWIITQGQDITSLINAEKQSEAARVQAEELARLRADFLAKMSHELRTPLNGILGVSQLLRGSTLDPVMLENINVLCNSGEHLLAVLNDILDFSKIEQGKYKIKRSYFASIEISKTIEKIFYPLCQEKGVEFVVETDFEESDIIATDQVRLNQILFNLVGNAIKFTHEGSVKVSITHTDNSHTENSVGSLLHIRVSDTGIGIDASLLERIFEPFVQASSSISREYGGSGLGLTITKSLIELLDGRYEIDSDLGRGTTFSIDIPVERVNREVSTTTDNLGETETAPAELFDRSLDVLLVEDNHTNAFIARAFCENYGMNITWVKDGQAAIEEVKNRQYDLVLMDNQLPKFSGIEATRIIREELQSKVAIFACTADGMLDTKQEFLDKGADYIIVKPIKQNELYQAFVYLKEECLSE